jgi:hypothetical protein
MDDAAPVMGQDDEDEQYAEGRRWDREKVHGGTLRQCVLRNVPQVGEGDDGRRPRYLATVVSAISMPNFWSSP